MSDDFSYGDDVEALLKSARADVGVPSLAKDHVRSMVTASVASVGGTPKDASSPSGARALDVSRFVVPICALVVGAVGGYYARGPVRAPAAHSQVVASAVPSSVPVPLLSESASEPAAWTPDQLPKVASAPPGSKDSLAEERALLDVARTALARGDYPHTLEATRTHERKFGRGLLAEEREALMIQALASSGDVPAARTRARAFRARYPESMFKGMVDGTVGSQP